MPIRNRSRLVFSAALLLLLLCVSLGASPQATPKSDAAVPKPSQSKLPGTEEYLTKSFDLKYADPEQVRQMFAGRSFVMEANSSLKVLTASGTAAFLKEVEDTVKRFDVAPAPPANIQITVYLLTDSAQAPAGGPLPKDLAAIGKDLVTLGAKGSLLADSQLMRVREGQPAEATSLPLVPDSATLGRVRLQSVYLTPGPKGDLISLNGLRVWINIPNPDKSPGAAKTEPDVSADMDLEPDQPAIAAKAGVDKPVVVVVRAVVVH